MHGTLATRTILISTVVFESTSTGLSLIRIRYRDRDRDRDDRFRDSSARVRYSDRDGGGGNGVMGHWSDVDSWAGTDAKGISEDDDCDADAGYGSGSGEKQGGSGRGGGAGPMAKAMQMVRSIKQLHNQKMELTRETVAILSRLGKRKGDLHDYASFGDNGKLVSKLRYTLEMKGKAWICHDMECDDDNIAGVLERGSLDPVGTYVPFDYMAGLSRHTTAAEVCLGAAQESNKGAWLMDVQKSISDESVDLVTINQGLHHIPPPRLLPFLQEVRRILRPGGVFLFREHDVNLDRGSKQTHGCPVEMVDLAHSVFNAVTGASSADEKREIRAFRPLQEWRDIVSSVGLADAMMQGMESGDCTCDEMLCFVKPPMNPSQSPLSLPPPPPPQAAKGHPRKRAKEEEFPDAPPLVGLIKTLLAQVPAASASSGGALVHSLTQLLGYMLPTVRAMLLTHMPQALKEEFPNAIDITSKLEPTVTANLKVVLSALEMLEEMIDRMEVNTEVDVPILYPEFFLVLPVIDRKVRERPEKASEVEVKLVEFLRSYLPALLVTASSSSSSSSSASDASISEGSATRDDGAPSDEAEEDGMSVEERENVVTGEEVLATLRQMETSLPDLLSPSTLAQSGFNVRQQGALAGKFGGRDMESTAKILASYLDRSSWNDAKEALLEAAALGLRPTKQRMLDVSSGGGAAPWHRATRAFLASPHVALTSAGKFGLSLIGLNEFSSLYDVVKQEVKERAAALDAPVGEVSRGPLVAIGDKDMKRGDREKVSDGIRALCSTGTILTRRFQFKDKEKDGSGVTILHVGKILRATYGYTSLTSRPTNITQGLRRHHEACVRESSVGTGEVGTLVVTEELCERLRNPGAAGGTLDHIRKGVVQVATFGQAGKSALTLTYRVVDDRKDKDEGRGKDKGKGGERDTPRDSTATGEGGVNANVDKAVIAGMLSSALRNSGVTRNLHVDSGAEYTWFKLCEWMQVEIMDLQVRSLDHTPWYRFPYLEILSVYFATLKDECAFVARKHGLRAAYGSMAFLTDVIPGIVMAFMYGQLKLLATPLLAAVDTEGYEDTHSVFLEEIVMFMHLDIEKTKAEEGAPGLLNRRSREDRIGAYFRSIDPNIKEVTAVGGLTGDTETGLSSGEADGAMVVVVSVPPFKPFSDLLLNIATFIPSAQILEISNQTELQVRVSCEEKHQEEATAWLVREFDESEVEIVTRYQFPISPDQARVPGRVQLALKVAVTQLLVLFRACGDSAQVGPRVLRVEQSYDCWNDTIREG
jgi:SAM-dependent methyltransferase